MLNDNFANFNLCLIHNSYKHVFLKIFCKMLNKALCVVTILSSLVFYSHETTALDDPEDVYLKGREAYLNYDYEGAYELYSKYIELCPYSAKGFYSRGNASLIMQEYNEAFDDFTKTIEIDPNYYQAYSNRGVVYSYLGKTDSAIIEFLKALEINPNDEITLNSLGVTYAQLDMIDEAYEYLNKAI